MKTGEQMGLNGNRLEVEVKGLVPLLKVGSKGSSKKEYRNLDSVFSVSVSMLYITK